MNRGGPVPIGDEPSGTQVVQPFQLLRPAAVRPDGFARLVVGQRRDVADRLPPEQSGDVVGLAGHMADGGVEDVGIEVNHRSGARGITAAGIGREALTAAKCAARSKRERVGRSSGCRITASGRPWFSTR